MLLRIIPASMIVTGWPAGNEGQTLLALTGEMYRYHNNLTAAHAASSPWWAWPLNLKPVWFYQGGFAGGTSASIYDAGNVVTWWMGIPAMAFVAYQAFRRQVRDPAWQAKFLSQPLAARQAFAAQARAASKQHQSGRGE